MDEYVSKPMQRRCAWLVVALCLTALHMCVDNRFRAPASSPRLSQNLYEGKTVNAAVADSAGRRLDHDNAPKTQAGTPPATTPSRGADEKDPKPRVFTNSPQSASTDSSQATKATSTKESAHNSTTTKHIIASPASPSTNASSTKTTTSTTSFRPSLWKNDNDLVHFIKTRYMQGQPNLLHLGKARNDLFRTFTLPSILAQTNTDFLWLIFTDPDLHEDLASEIVEMIAPHPHIFLLGMNNNLYDFRSMKQGWMKKVKKVFSGNLQLLYDYGEASQSRVVLETRLDADDSIFVELVDAVQKQAANTLGRRAAQFDHDAAKLLADARTKEYRVFCTEHHLEWGYFNPWNKTSDKGHLLGITHPSFCISAGLTYAYQIGTTSKDLVTISHNQISKRMPDCDDGTADNLNCVERIDDRDYHYIMLRSRTPTSAGMQGVIPSKKLRESTTWPHQQDETWKVLQRNFNVTPPSIWELRARFQARMKDILMDALAGQCISKPEFTCKTSTKQALSNLLEAVQEHDQSSTATLLQPDNDNTKDDKSNDTKNDNTNATVSSNANTTNTNTTITTHSNNTSSHTSSSSS